MRCKIMSTHTEHSAWSPDDTDSLENIDKEIQLVSTSTESYSNNGSGGYVKLISDTKESTSRQSNIFQSKSHDNLQAIKANSSGNNIHQTEKKLCDKNTKDHPYTLLNHSAKETASEDATKKLKNGTANSINRDKQDYLEQINKQLTKELDEKNAILALLQENYEHLLFKYAEAQNRIDELRIKFIAEKTKPNQTSLNKSPTIVTPIINLDEPSTPPSENFVPISRPSSLPLDNNLKFGDRDLLKATTPTDSEGLSSIITSMSGHSKILNSLDEENQINKKYRYKKNFALQENVASNDPFDKVKNWQNSLPPLEQIETPETTLYNVNSGDTNYKEISSPKIEFVFSDESCPLSWREETEVNKTEFYPKKNEIKTKKRPPLLRCASLPAYNRVKNGIYIPPLDLNNVTLSDDESYCQVDAPTSGEQTVNKSIQTPPSFSSCKATITDERVPRQTISKSTSITPVDKCCTDRCNVCGEAMDEKNRGLFGSRSNSCESVQKKEYVSTKRPKPPFKRSISFNSATTTPRYCTHEKPPPIFFNLNEDTEENFDAYASNLRMRSQVAIKALTAHVNNS